MDLHNYSTFLKKKFIDQLPIKIIDKNTKEIELKSLNELGHFVLYSFKEHFFDLNNKQDLYMFIHHMWFPFFSAKKRHILRDFFSQNKNYIFVKNRGLVNRVFSVFYRKYGKVKLGAKLDEFFDMIIQGDCIAKIYMAKELRHRMDKVYRTRNPFNSRIIDEFSDFTYANYKIKLIITRDAELAEEIKQKLRSL